MPSHAFPVRPQSNVLLCVVDSMSSVRSLTLLLLLACALVLSRDPRQEKKASIVKKFLKKHKKREGEIQLVDGAADHEGECRVRRTPFPPQLFMANRCVYGKFAETDVTYFSLVLLYILEFELENQIELIKQMRLGIAFDRNLVQFNLLSRNNTKCTKYKCLYRQRQN